jgi:hypothetical protein
MLAQILPARICRFDQCDLLGSCPAFDLFFPADRRLHPVIAFEIDESMTLVFLREALECPISVLPNAMLQIASDARVEHTGITCHDVNGVEVLAHSASILRFRMHDPDSMR